MKMNKILAAMAATAISATAFAAMSISSASAADKLGDAYLIGNFGTEGNWNAGENSGVSVATVDGDAQYQATWDLAAETATGDSWFLSVVLFPDGVDNFTTDTFPELNVTLDEVYVDGTQITDLSGAVINTAFYENNKPGVTRIFLHDDWAGTKANAIESGDIHTNIKVLFTVSGTGQEGTSNVTKEEVTTTTTAAGGSGDTTTTTTTAAASGDGTTTTTKKGETKATTTTTKASGSGNVASASTGDLGAGAAVAALSLAAVAAFAARKKD